MKRSFILFTIIALLGLNSAMGQWTTSGSNIFNSNTGNVGIGNNSPTTLLHVAKLMTEPTITVQNLGGTGGATYTMIDAVSGANWKFKATNTGGFKIRDHAYLLDVFVIEPNSAANSLYIDSAGNVGLGTTTPSEKLGIDGNIIFTKSSNRTISVELENSDFGSGKNLTLMAGAANGNNYWAAKGGDLILQGGAGHNQSEGAAGGGDLFLRSGTNILSAISGIPNGGDIILETGGPNSTFIERVRIMEAGNVGIGTATPASSAALDITSTTQGLLPPRLTTAQISAITSPVAGLMVYNSTTNIMQYYNGTSWVNM